MTPPQPPGMFESRRWLGILVLFVVTVLAYLPAVDGEFIWDDDSYVEQNYALRTWDGLRRIWSHWGTTPQYYPMVFTTFWLEYHLWGLETTGYHLTNILLHASNAALVWIILCRLKVPGAWAAAAIFALHPVHVESVAWITERKNVLSGFFYLTALLAYLRFARVGEEEGPKRWTAYMAAELLFVLALLSKTVTATLPVAILLILWWQQPKLKLADGLYLVPLFAWGLVLSLVTIYFERVQVGAVGPDWDFTFAERFLIAGHAVWFYAWKLLVPYPLAFFYGRWDIDPTSFLQVMVPIAAAPVVALLFMMRRRIGKGPVVAVLYFGVTLAPALGFVSFYPMRFSFVADHFQYLASLGLITLAAAGGTLALHRYAGRGMAPRVAIGAAVLLMLGVLTWRQAGVYEDLDTLWRDTIAKVPTSWAAHNNLAVLLADRGDWEEAEEHFLRAIELNPDAPEPYTNYGALLEERQEYQEARRQYGKALAVDRDYPEANLRLGQWARRAGRIDLAIELLSVALDRDRMNPQAHNFLGLALAEKAERDGRRELYDLAVKAFLTALQLNPRYDAAHVNLGNVLVQLGDRVGGLSHYQIALSHNPNSARAHRAVGRWYVQEKQPLRAIEHYRAAIELRPDWYEPAIELAWVLATDPDDTIRDGEEALDLAQRALEMADPEHPDYPRYLDILAASYAEAGQFDLAVETAQRAQRMAVQREDEGFAEQVERRLALYRKQQPYRAPLSGP